ncbi:MULTISPECIES: DUF397 domain-containing protein [unclassified Streptomyces]|uniref:DUF397 domain-containing protein n=1 Tax=unclassified Streptomyces TaxID=2593676 RepID=UPI0022537E67|nr:MULTISPECIES: DUF397 domain-containing protein [unclassified Streptomyces]MCX4881810.1 DUF397 domain-containing protein [Streptomyces sp. NBC_00847]MCX5421803.1 DUF397 domain-containing protein [Streptomyces sp. NBC_00078]
MQAIDLTSMTWRKSSYSNSDGGACLEVSDDVPSLVPVRDSKDPALGALVFSAFAWAEFVESVKGR